MLEREAHETTRDGVRPGGRLARRAALCLLVLATTATACGGRTGPGGSEPADAAAGPAAQEAAADATPDAGGPPSLCGIVADSGGGPCTAQPPYGLSCCGEALVNLENDPLNCGACGARCAPGETCRGSCIPADCATTCSSCQQCCHVNTAGPARPPSCFDGPTCPVGCPGCT
ncbi:MAG TPA: hypothetical protein VIY73_16540 [Polyangiaceae bacterium]